MWPFLKKRHLQVCENKRLIGFYRQMFRRESHTDNPKRGPHRSPSPPPLRSCRPTARTTLSINGGLWEGLWAGWLAGFTICRVWPTSLSPANPFVPAISEYLATSNPLCCFISALDFISSKRLPDDTLHSPHQLVLDVHWICICHRFQERERSAGNLKCNVMISSSSYHLEYIRLEDRQSLCWI